MQQEFSVSEIETDIDAVTPLHRSRSAERVLALLDAVVTGGELSLTAAAARTDMPASTALRHLRVLTDRGYLVKGSSGSYSVGPAFVRTALASLQSGPYARLRAAAQPELERLVETTEESAYLAVRDGDAAVYIATVEGRRAIRHVGWVGRSVPIDGTAVGEALLAAPPVAWFAPHADLQYRRHRARCHRRVCPNQWTGRANSGPVCAWPGRSAHRRPPADGSRCRDRSGARHVVRAVVRPR